jgi:hypothetical protein
VEWHAVHATLAGTMPQSKRAEQMSEAERTNVERSIASAIIHAQHEVMAMVDARWTNTAKARAAVEAEIEQDKEIIETMITVERMQDMWRQVKAAIIKAVEHQATRWREMVRGRVSAMSTAATESTRLNTARAGTRAANTRKQQRQRNTQREPTCEACADLAQTTCSACERAALAMHPTCIGAGPDGYCKACARAARDGCGGECMQALRACCDKCREHVTEAGVQRTKQAKRTRNIPPKDEGATRSKDHDTGGPQGTQGAESKAGDSGIEAPTTQRFTAEMINLAMPRDSGQSSSGQGSEQKMTTRDQALHILGKQYTGENKKRLSARWAGGQREGQIFRGRRAARIITQRGDRLIGLCKALITEHETYIDELLTREGERGKGHAVRMIAVAIAAAPTTPRVRIQIRSDDSTAQAFCTAIGMKEWNGGPRTETYSGVEPSNEHEMWMGEPNAILTEIRAIQDRHSREAGVEITQEWVRTAKESDIATGGQAEAGAAQQEARAAQREAGATQQEAATHDTGGLATGTRGRGAGASQQTQGAPTRPAAGRAAGKRRAPTQQAQHSSGTGDSRQGDSGEDGATSTKKRRAGDNKPRSEAAGPNRATRITTQQQHNTEPPSRIQRERDTLLHLIQTETTATSGGGSARKRERNETPDSTRPTGASANASDSASPTAQQTNSAREPKEAKNGRTPKLARKKPNVTVQTWFRESRAAYDAAMRDGKWDNG